MSLKDRLIDEYGLENRDIDDEGNLIDGKSLLKICMTNARFVMKDGKPSFLPNFPMIGIGSIGSAYNLQGLQDAKVTHILCCSGVIRLKYPESFIYHRIDIQDKSETDLSSYWQSCWDFIDKALKIPARCTSSNEQSDLEEFSPRILIHCYQGISRSTSILSSYLMKEFGLSLLQALDEIRSVRPVAAPNPGFLLQLHALERQLTTKYT